MEVVDPPTTEVAKKELVDKLWPLTQEANTRCPAYGLVTQELILFTEPEKPLPRASKGTVQRRLAFETYGAELKYLYETQHTTVSTSDKLLSGPEGSEMLQEEILAIVRSLGFLHVTTQTNLCDLGSDSLHVMTLNTRLNGRLQQLGLPAAKASTKAIYASPGNASLAASLLDQQEAPDSSPEDMHNLYKRYVSDLPITVRETLERPSQHTIMLTGSTGSLGTNLLDELLRDNSAKKVYCLNRGADGEARQKAIMRLKGLAQSFQSKNVSFVQVDLSKDHLGLDIESYKVLLREVTLIVQRLDSGL